MQALTWNDVAMPLLWLGGPIVLVGFAYSAAYHVKNTLSAIRDRLSASSMPAQSEREPVGDEPPQTFGETTVAGRPQTSFDKMPACYRKALRQIRLDPQRRPPSHAAQCRVDPIRVAAHRIDSQVCHVFSA